MGFTSFTISDNVLYLRDSALYGFTGLTSMTLPNGISHIKAEFKDVLLIMNNSDGAIRIYSSFNKIIVENLSEKKAV